MYVSISYSLDKGLIPSFASEPSLLAHRGVLGPLEGGEQEAQVAVAEGLADAHELAQGQDG